MQKLLQQLPHSLGQLSGKPAFRRTAIGLVIFIVFIGLFGYFSLPGIIKSQAEKIISEKLNRQTMIGQVEVSPYAMRFTFRDVKMMEPEGDVKFAGFEALTVNLSIQSLFRFAPVIKQLQVSAPYVRLVRKDDTHYNIDDIIELINNQPPSPEPARFSVFNIEIDKGYIEFDDRPAKTLHKVTDLKIGVPFVSSLHSKIDVLVEPLLSANINGTPLLIKGKALPFADPVQTVVDLKLDNLDLTTYLKYIPGTPRFKVPSARLDLHLIANFHQTKDKAPVLLLSGNIKLKSLQLNDQDNRSILKLPELTVTLKDASLLSEHIDVAKLSINGIEADITRNSNQQFNFEKLLTPPTAKPAVAAESTKSKAVLSFALAELDIKNAALRFTDMQVAHPMQAKAEKFDLRIRKIEVDTGSKTVSIDEVISNKAAFFLQQDKPRVDAGNVATTPPSSKVTNDDASAAYTISIKKVSIDNWSARLEDRSLKRPAVTTIEPLKLAMQDISSKAGARGKIDLQAAVNKTGKLAVSGDLGMAPLHANLALDLMNVDIMQVQPYITDKINILLTRADISSKGMLQIDEGENGEILGGFKGDLTLSNLAIVDKLSTSEFLRWKSLYFGGMDVRLAPLALSIDQIMLNDFFARVILDPNGRINFQDIRVANTDGVQKSVTQAEPTTAPAPLTAAIAEKTAVLPPSSKAASDITPIKINKLTMQGGHVRFTDNLIKPNYTANLMKFGGVISGLSSDVNSSANVNLKGEVNSAPLNIDGKINPLKGDLTMDIKAAVHGMELASLSTYSYHYTGYGIEKGKLSFDVAYKVENRVLTAQNRLVLEQLTLGAKIESPTATTLPVRFALALLRDSNGVIDINLPIDGSLDDPQFSVGGLFVKAIVNVMAKAVTSPFSLLSSIFGGGEELSLLEFDSGRAHINDAAEAKLKIMAKILQERPALKLEITGRTDPEADREDLKKASIDRKVRELKLKDMVARGESADAATLTVTQQEYPALLKRVHEDETFSKPRNMVGVQKDLPAEEMENLLSTHASVSDDDLTALANHRAQAVKDWLTSEGKVPDTRIFILGSKSGNQGAKDEATQAKANRVDFSLR